MKVKDVMHTSVMSLPQNASLQDVLQKFVKNRLDAVPIIDAAERVVGLVTVHDLVDHFLPRYFDVLRDFAALEDKGQLASLFDLSFEGMDLAAEKLILAADIMHSKIQWVRMDDPLLAAASRLQLQRQSRLPVVDRDGKLVGMIHDYDIILALLSGTTRLPAAKAASR
jgi:CBS-domain-containing membrane protein